MSKQSLSKGTLGLKFMNRTIPPSTPPQPNQPNSSTQTTSTTAPSSSLNLNNKGRSPATESIQQQEGNDWNKPKHSSSTS